MTNINFQNIQDVLFELTKTNLSTAYISVLRSQIRFLDDSIFQITRNIQG